MSIQNSLNFLYEAGRNPSLRSTLNTMDRNLILNYLSDKGFDFTQNEFENAVNLLLLRCQFEEDSTAVYDIANWFRMLFN
jgi:hypothetical protein